MGVSEPERAAARSAWEVADRRKVSFGSGSSGCAMEWVTEGLPTETQDLVQRRTGRPSKTSWSWTAARLVRREVPVGRYWMGCYRMFTRCGGSSGVV